MNIGILGTGIVGRTIAEGLVAKGHDVSLGTRDLQATMQRDSASGATRTPFRDWHAGHTSVKLGTFTEAARFGEVVVNATSGGGHCSRFGCGCTVQLAHRCSTSRSFADARLRR